MTQAEKRDLFLQNLLDLVMPYLESQVTTNVLLIVVILLILFFPLVMKVMWFPNVR